MELFFCFVFSSAVTQAAGVWMSSSSGTTKTTSRSDHLLIVLHRAVLNHVGSGRGVVPRHLLDLEEVFPGHGGDARRSAAQQHCPPQSQPLHYRGRSGEELRDPQVSRSPLRLLSSRSVQENQKWVL